MSATIQQKLALPLKRGERKAVPLDVSYFSNKKSAGSTLLRGCNSVAQFMARTKGNNLSFQMNPGAGLDLSLSNVAVQTPGKPAQKRHLRASKSCVKNCRFSASDNERLDLSMQQHNRLESIYLPEKKHLLYSASTSPVSLTFC